MAPPTDPKAKAPELPPDSGEPTPHPRYDERIEGDAFEVMQKYQVVTLPPNARLELMKMKLPEAPPELLQDTVPPNGAVRAPAVREDTTDAPVVDSSRSNDTMIIPRVQRQQRLRSVVVASLCAGVVLLVIGFVVTWGGQSGDPAEGEPAEVQVSPINAAVEPEAPASVPAVPPIVAPPSVVPAPTAGVSTTKAAEKQAARVSESGRKPAVADVQPDVRPPPGSEPSKSATQPQKPAPASSARGKQPWIDGL